MAEEQDRPPLTVLVAALNSRAGVTPRQREGCIGSRTARVLAPVAFFGECDHWRPGPPEGAGRSTLLQPPRCSGAAPLRPLRLPPPQLGLPLCRQGAVPRTILLIRTSRPVVRGRALSVSTHARQMAVVEQVEEGSFDGALRRPLAACESREHGDDRVQPGSLVRCLPRPPDRIAELEDPTVGGNPSTQRSIWSLLSHVPCAPDRAGH